MAGEPAPDRAKDAAFAGMKAAIRAKAREVGFDALGFASAVGSLADREHLAAFIADGRHGDMAWMAATADRRADPQALWPEAKSLIAVGINYGPAEDPTIQLRRRERAAISVYAQGRDYHKVLKSRLKRLGIWLAETYACGVKVFVDTAPLMEKPAAMRAGLGWIGKHTNLVSREFGSWLFLGEILTSLAIPPDPPEVDHCGRCDRCIRACPTDALAEPYRIDPRRCISYLTIEHKGAIDAGLMARMGNRVYGCDDCLAACPWTKFTKPAEEADLRPRAHMAGPRLADLAELDEAAFRAMTEASPVRRTGHERFVRNVLVAIGNSQDGSLAPFVAARLTDASPLVREAAIWALKQLSAAKAASLPARAHSDAS